MFNCDSLLELLELVEVARWLLITIFGNVIDLEGLHLVLDDNSISVDIGRDG